MLHFAVPMPRLAARQEAVASAVVHTKEKDMKTKTIMIGCALAALVAGCCKECEQAAKAARKPVQEVKFVEIDPGHFHAALVRAEGT